MDHLAIMRKSWGLLLKILTGDKTIESRWYKNRSLPWDKIKKGDRVYFKDSGQPVSVRAEVLNVLQFSNLNPVRVKEILNKYGQRDGLGVDKVDKYYRMFRDKNYCLLVFLDRVKEIEPFEIDKKGFGSMSAWITIDNIDKIKK